MHPDIRKLNKNDPPPKGHKHPAYDIYGREGAFLLSYLDKGKWNQPITPFKTKELALRFLLDKLYYG